MSSQIQTYYPNFAPNQVLTDTQLNHMRIYLDQQNRLTRTRMIGSGIICGLQGRYEHMPPKTGETEVHKIYISPGYGVSSDGYLLELTQEASYQQFIEYTGIDADEDGTMDYESWEKASQKIYELVPAGNSSTDYKDDAIRPLAEEYIKERVLVLYLECKAADLKSCAITDCSNKGEQIEFKVRALLVHEDDIDAMSNLATLNNDTLTSLKELQIFVPRFHTAIDDASDPMNDILSDCKLLLINETKDIGYAYGELSKASSKTFCERLETIANDNLSRGNFLNLPEIDSYVEKLADLIKERQNSADFTQYHYGFVKDLANGFNEFLASYCSLVKDCGSPSGYPRHLMLRRLIADTSDPDGGVYRHNFQPSPVKNVADESWRISRDLFMRLLAMIDNFRAEMLLNYTEILTYSDGIRITPSQEPMHPMGTQAIPYYFRVQDQNLAPTQLVKYWQSASTCTLDPIHSYYYHKEYPPISDGTPINAYPLHYGIQKNSFYRIEGHIGKNCEQVSKELEVLCKVYNLEFDLLTLYTDYPKDYVEGQSEPVMLFRDFVSKKWGMEYMGGVRPGGTFILVCDPKCPGKDDDIIVADFALTGNITACELIEPPTNVICPVITEVKQFGLTPDPANPQNYDVEFEVLTIGPQPDSYTWDFGNGTDGTGKTTKASYERGYGTNTSFTAIVTVVGPGQNCGETSKVTVNVPMICPIMTAATFNETSASSSTEKHYEVSLSFDPNQPTDLRPTDVKIEWGDGTLSNYTSLTNISHTYERKDSDVIYDVLIEYEGPDEAGKCKSRFETTIEVPAREITDNDAIVAEVQVGAVGNIPAGQLSRGLNQTTPEAHPITARRQQRIQSLYKFNEGGTYSRNRTYQSALEFVGDDNISANKLDSSFKDVLGKLKSVYKRASGQKESDYQAMISIVLESYMDRLVELTPSALPTGARETLKEEISDLKSQFGIKATSLKKSWKAADIKKVTDAKVVDQINKLIK